MVSYVAALTMEEIADFSLPRGIAEKHLLRIVAGHLGLTACTTLAKRAIQFGTRLAKYTNRHAGESQRSASGTSSMIEF